MVVYLVKNAVNGKPYVGKTALKLSTRWNSHVARANSGSLTHLHRAIKKYGIDCFVLSVLEHASTEAELNRLEIKYIEELRSNDPNIGYNLTRGGEGAMGYKHALKAKLSMSRAVRPPLTDKQCAKISVANLEKSTAMALRC